VALVITNVSEDRIGCIIRLRKMGGLETTLAVSINRSTLRTTMILVTLVMEATSSSETLFLQEPHGGTYQMMAFFVKFLDSNVTLQLLYVIFCLSESLWLIMLLTPVSQRTWHCGERERERGRERANKHAVHCIRENKFSRSDLRRELVSFESTP
jgi:hypothetical protein